MNPHAEIPCWYWIVAIIVSLYQMTRGAWIRWKFAPSKKKGSVSDPVDNSQRNTPPTWSSVEKIFLLCAADGLLYCLTTFSGFLALLFAYLLFQDMSKSGVIDLGFVVNCQISFNKENFPG